jgi:hypothetical protein
MPYIDDLDFSNDLNDNDKIWRYINFVKFVSMLESKSLYFLRSDNLLKIDPYEGYFHEMQFHDGYKKYGEIYPKLKEEAREHHPKFLFVNCWHINPNQSDAMWKIYSKDDNGIAIQSTIGRLKKSFADTSKEIRSGKIRYVDHEKEKLIYKDVFERFLSKPMGYSHENELRLCLHEIVDNEHHGLDIRNNLSILIEKIYVSPLSTSWFLDLVKHIYKKYGYDVDQISKSNLYEKPSFE